MAFAANFIATFKSMIKKTSKKSKTKTQDYDGIQRQTNQYKFARGFRLHLRNPISGLTCPKKLIFLDKNICKTEICPRTKFKYIHDANMLSQTEGIRGRIKQKRKKNAKNLN